MSLAYEPNYSTASFKQLELKPPPLEGVLGSVTSLQKPSADRKRNCAVDKPADTTLTSRPPTSDSLPRVAARESPRGCSRKGASHLRCPLTTREYRGNTREPRTGGDPTESQEIRKAGNCHRPEKTGDEGLMGCGVLADPAADGGHPWGGGRIQ